MSEASAGRWACGEREDILDDGREKKGEACNAGGCRDIWSGKVGTRRAEEGGAVETIGADTGRWRWEDETDCDGIVEDDGALWGRNEFMDWRSVAAKVARRVANSGSVVEGGKVGGGCSGFVDGSWRDGGLNRGEW